MSDTNERFIIALLLSMLIGALSIVNADRHKQTQSQLTAYQDSVNVLIAENIRLNDVQFKDAMGVKPESPMMFAVERIE